MQQLEDALNALYRCEHIEELLAAMQALASRLGYAGYAYVDSSRLALAGEPLPFHLTTLRADFHASYCGQNFFTCDPVVFRAAATNVPFTWANCPEFRRGSGRRRGRKTKAQKVLELAYDFGYEEGFVVPAHALGPNGELSSSYVSLFWEGSSKRFGTPETMPQWLRLAVLTFHERMIDMQGIVSSEPGARPSFTDRERECLIWACRGKTSLETAVILGIGERTVEFHLQNAMNKLGVHNKVHAAAIGIRLGLIVP